MQLSTDFGGDDAHRWTLDATVGPSRCDERLIAETSTCRPQPCRRPRRSMLMTAAEEVLQLGVTEMEQPRMPFERAVLELACGRALRRAGQRRISAGQLQVARDLTAPLDPHPYLERRDGGLAAGGQSATVRSDFDCRRLTAQESAVAKLVGAGMDDRHVARELFIGIPTVKFHLTHIYTKLGINSRLELGALLEQARG